MSPRLTADVSTEVPYTLQRAGVVMSPEEGNPLEEMGVLNPASGRGPDGRLMLLPRLVAAGNVSRVGLAEVVVEGGVPVGVRREGVVLAPDEGWERGANNAGVEDPRTTYVASLGLHLMTYVAYGPLGPRLALAVSLANYLSNVAGRASNPYGAILAGACVLAAPAVALFVAFQRHFTSSDIGSGVKG